MFIANYNLFNLFNFTPFIHFLIVRKKTLSLLSNNGVKFWYKTESGHRSIVFSECFCPNLFLEGDKSQSFGFTSCSTAKVMVRHRALPLVVVEPTKVSAYDKMPNLLY